MVGAVNDGWKVITDALAAERVMIGGTRMAAIERAFDRLTEYVKTAVVGGKPLRNDPVIRDRIGALAADIEVARQFQMRNSRLVEQGKVPIHEAAMGKVFTSELQERLGQAALDILGTGGLLSEDAPSAPVGEMEQVLRHSIMGMIGGGTNEIQRNVIALRGLDLPALSITRSSHERREYGHLRAGRRDRPGRPQPSGQAQLLQSGRDEGVARGHRARRRGGQVRHHLRPWRQLLRRPRPALGRGELEDRALASGCRSSSTATAISR